MGGSRLEFGCKNTLFPLLKLSLEALCMNLGGIPVGCICFVYHMLLWDTAVLTMKRSITHAFL